MAYQFLEQNLNFFSSGHVRPLFRSFPKFPMSLRVKSKVLSIGCKVWQNVAPATFDPKNSPCHSGCSPSGHDTCAFPLETYTAHSVSSSQSLFKCYLFKGSSMSSTSNQQPYTHTQPASPHTSAEKALKDCLGFSMHTFCCLTSL